MSCYSKYVYFLKRWSKIEKGYERKWSIWAIIWSASLCFSEVICNLKLNRGGERGWKGVCGDGKYMCELINYTPQTKQISKSKIYLQNNQKHISHNSPFMSTFQYGCP